MTTVTEASEIVHSTRIPKNVIKVPLLHAMGKVLQEDILADRDFPPFNRVAMDGIAINFSSLQPGWKFLIEKEQYAGQPQKQLENYQNCIEVMTGAMLPLGCDTVVKYEDLVIIEKDSVRTAQVKVIPASPGEHVHKQGSDRLTGETLVQKGTTLSAAEVAIATTVGKVWIHVTGQPKIALISTGDELVDPSVIPLPHQIRKSNIYALKAALQENLFEADDFHLPDLKEVLHQKLKEMLEQYDVLILSGGVSMGKADLVPEILEVLGVEKLFHKVAQRPGKPFWFGKFEDSKVVFALPGNPVSTFITFYKYCLPWLKRHMGVQNPIPIQAILKSDVAFNPPLTNFLQVKVQIEEGRIMAVPYSGKGSGDLANLSDCDGFIELTSEETIFKAGNSFPIVFFKNIIFR